jgi:hypothetical protein
MADGRISPPQVRDGRVTFEVRNVGKIHLLARSVSVSGLATDGTIVFERELPGWYILASGTRRYVIPVPEVCRGLDSIRISVHTAEITYSERFAAVPSGCPG